MDERFIGIGAWEIEEIPDGDSLYRHVHFSKYDKTDKFPLPDAFIPDPDGLSLYWEKYVPHVKEVYYLIGLSFTAKSKFKDHTGFLIFKIPKNNFIIIDGVQSVSHDPLQYAMPKVGRPNNRSHSLAIYDDSNLQVRQILSAYCRGNYKTCFCKFDLNSINKELNELRDRLENTPYHKH